MNGFYKQISGLMFCAMLATAAPMYSMENEVNEDSSAAWYKQRSVQIAAVAITTAAAIYAFAVYKGKVSSPAALWAGLFCAQVVKTIATQPSEDKNSGNIEQNNNPVMIVVDKTSENNTQDNTVIPEVTQHNETQDNQLNEENNEQDSQNTEIKIIEQKEEIATEQKDVAVTNDTVTEPKIDVIERAKSLFAQFKKDASQWVTSDEI